MVSSTYIFHLSEEQKMDKDAFEFDFPYDLCRDLAVSNHIKFELNYSRVLSRKSILTTNFFYISSQGNVDRLKYQQNHQDTGIGNIPVVRCNILQPGRNRATNHLGMDLILKSEYRFHFDWKLIQIQIK